MLAEARLQLRHTGLQSGDLLVEQVVFDLDLRKQGVHEGTNCGGVVAQSSGEISGGGFPSCMDVASRISGTVSNQPLSYYHVSRSSRGVCTDTYSRYTLV